MYAIIIILSISFLVKSNIIHFQKFIKRKTINNNILQSEKLNPINIVHKQNKKNFCFDLSLFKYNKNMNLNSKSKVTLLYDVSNILPILGFKNGPANFDLKIEKNIILKLSSILVLPNLLLLLKHRIVVGSTMTKNAESGFLNTVDNKKIYNSPGMKSSFWGINNSKNIQHIYPNLLFNHIYLEYRDFTSPENKVDYYGAKIAKKILNDTDILILLSGDGNKKEDYGFRDLVNDAIKIDKKVIVVAIQPNKYYKELAIDNKIILSFIK
jgi:hypothetical protein